MILIVHEKGKKVLEILHNEEEVPVLNKNINSEVIRMARLFPEELIFWVNNKFRDNFNSSGCGSIFHHELIMCSYPVENKYLPEAIGYIDQWPFASPDYSVTYATWRMSIDVGGMTGKTLLIFESLIRRNSDFGYNLNSIAKVGQQNGLFCYSEPKLLMNRKQSRELNSLSGDTALFSFVYQHYKLPWVFILFCCFLRYHSKYYFGILLKSFFMPKHFKKDFDLPLKDVNSTRYKDAERESVDVVIPTLGRPEHLRQVLLDLSAQMHLPKKVVVVEQNPDLDSKTQLLDIQEMNWPFELVHYFIHEVGACNARNLALKDTVSNWIFFADDDIRINPEILEKSIREAKRLGVGCLNINCKQPEQETVFYKIKQWASFGAGTSIVNSNFARNTFFSDAFENGYGEDQDYGMQLRQKGCDIVYHPNIDILHLKAPRGGFREKSYQPWDNAKVKPSPTILIYAYKYFSVEQLRGYKVALFLKYYNRQEIKNPWRYFKAMQERWKESGRWAAKIEKKNKDRSGYEVYSKQ